MDVKVNGQILHGAKIVVKYTKILLWECRMQSGRLQPDSRNNVQQWEIESCGILPELRHAKTVKSMEKKRALKKVVM